MASKENGNRPARFLERACSFYDRFESVPIMSVHTDQNLLP